MAGSTWGEKLTVVRQKTHLEAESHSHHKDGVGPMSLELVAGSGKHVGIVVVSTDIHGNLPTKGHVIGRAAHPITPVG